MIRLRPAGFAGDPNRLGVSMVMCSDADRHTDYSVPIAGALEAGDGCKRSQLAADGCNAPHIRLLGTEGIGIARVGGKDHGPCGYLDGLLHLWPTKGLKRNMLAMRLFLLRAI